MNKQNLITGVFLLVNIVFVNAQEKNEMKSHGTIVTDRPDQTEASSVMPKGFLQIETGTFYEIVEIDNGFIKEKRESTTFNTTLLRYGLLDNLELRVGFDFIEESKKINGNTLDDIASGFSPLSLGVKIGITEEKGTLPEIAFIGHVNMSFLASNDFKTKSIGTDFRFSLSHTLSKKSSLGYNIGMAWDGNTTTAIYLYTIAYGHSFTDKLGGFIELYGDIYEDSNFDHLWNVGLTYLLNENIQLDISGGTGVTKNIQDLILSSGISIRLPR